MRFSGTVQVNSRLEGMNVLSSNRWDWYDTVLFVRIHGIKLLTQTKAASMKSCVLTVCGLLLRLEPYIWNVSGSWYVFSVVSTKNQQWMFRCVGCLLEEFTGWMCSFKPLAHELGVIDSCQHGVCHISRRLKSVLVDVHHFWICFAD